MGFSNTKGGQSKYDFQLAALSRAKVEAKDKYLRELAALEQEESELEKLWGRRC